MMFVATGWKHSLLFALLLGGQGCQSTKLSESSSREAPSHQETARAHQTFGAEFELTTTTPLEKVLVEPESYVGKKLLIEGRVERACSKKGCWMELSAANDPSSTCRVTFKDYAFFVPTNSAGRRARVEGLVEVKPIPRSHVEHLEAEGAQFSKKNPDGTAHEVRFVATGVELSPS